MLRALDDWLLDTKVQPLVWRIEYYVGWNQFACARALLLLYPVGALLGIFSLPTETPEDHTWQIHVSFLVFVLSTILFLVGVACEKQIRAQSTEGTRSWVRGAALPLRFGFVVGWLLLCALLLSYPVFLFLVAHTGLVLFVYFMSCDNMPRKWAEDREVQKAKAELKVSSS